MSVHFLAKAHRISLGKYVRNYTIVEIQYLNETRTWFSTAEYIPLRGEVCNSVSGYVVYRHVLNHKGYYRHMIPYGAEPELLNYYGSQESIPRNQFRQHV
jgi:hypothetical protein